MDAAEADKRVNAFFDYVRKNMRYDSEMDKSGWSDVYIHAPTDFAREGRLKGLYGKIESICLQKRK